MKDQTNAPLGIGAGVGLYFARDFDKSSKALAVGLFNGSSRTREERGSIFLIAI